MSKNPETVFRSCVAAILKQRYSIRKRIFVAYMDEERAHSWGPKLYAFLRERQGHVTGRDMLLLARDWIDEHQVGLVLNDKECMEQLCVGWEHDKKNWLWAKMKFV